MIGDLGGWWDEIDFRRDAGHRLSAGPPATALAARAAH
jgi:hypothetical protein